MNNLLLQSDNFASGSLAAGWSAWPGLSLPSVVVGSPNVIEPTAISTSDGVIWTGQTWGNDQIVEVVINSLANTGNASVVLGARIVASGAGGHPQGYQVVLNPTASNAVLQSFSNGSATTLKTVGGVTISAGDIWTFAVIGSVLFVYRNGARIGFVTDSNFTGGSPGVFVQSNSTAANTAQVSAIRLYSVKQQDGIWTKQGCILLGNSTEMGGSPSGNAGLSVNYGPSVFLSVGNNCYRGYWVYRNSSTPEVAYAESLDGVNWTRYSSNPVISGYGGGCVNWVGSTAYMWGQSSPGSNEPNFFTSTDGVTWTNHGACTGLSVAGYSCYSICGLVIISGTYYGLFGALNISNSSAPVTFLATSTDGLTWTLQNSGNPVANTFCGCNLFVLNGTYYMPGTSNQPGQNAPAAANFDPVCAVLYQSTDLVNWSISSPIIQNSLISDALNNPDGGCAPLCMVNVNGTAYLYYQGSPADATAPQDYQCMLATAPVGASLANIVKFSQTGLSQVASDAFTNGPGPLSSNWTTPSWSVGALQIVSGPFVEANITSGSRCTALYTGASFGRNQYSQVTIQTLAGTVGDQFINLLVLAQNGSQQTAYYAQIPCPTGTQTSSINFQIQKVVNGTPTTLSGTTTPIQITPHVGDIFMFSVVQGSDGSNILTIFQNGIQVLMAQDFSSPLASGLPGMQINAKTLANAQISAWAGGNANVIPTYSHYLPLVFKI